MTELFPEIKRLLGLHQRLVIIYFVDSYIARLEHEEGYPYPEIQGKGKSIGDALCNLDVVMESISSWKECKK